MNFLELYSHKSKIENEAKEKGIFIMSVDLKEQYEYKVFPPKYFDYIYATPKTKEHLIKTLQIIEYLRPRYWFIDYLNKNCIDILSLEDAVSYEFKMAGKKKMLIWSNLKKWKMRPDCKFSVEDFLDAVNVVCFR